MKALFFSLAGASLFLQACENRSPGESDQQPLGDTTPPVIGHLILNRNPNPAAPLAAILSLSTDEPATVTVQVDDGERTWDATLSNGLATEHSLIVLGMRPGLLHHITAVVSDASGNVTESRPLPMEMPPLPTDLAQPELVYRNADLMEPGVTLFNAFLLDSAGDAVDEFGGVLYMVDDRGEVVWFYRSHLDVGDARRLRNGNLIFQAGFNGLVVEIDMLGNVVQQWHAVGTTKEVPEGSLPVDVDSLHHEIFEMPSGNLLALGSELRVYENYPTSDSDPEAARGRASVIGDTIVEFSRDGTVVREWKLLDLLDPYRIGYGSLASGYWASRYEDLVEDPEEAPIRDWSHSNAVVYDPSDDSYIVSVRHQDAVIKVARETGELVWILGPPDDWQEPWASRRLQPVGDLEWQYHEHGPVLTADGTIVLYDNGNERAGAYQDPMPLTERYSRAVEFSVHAAAMEVQQVWSYGPADERFYSRYVSDADWLPVTGNVLITDGARETDAQGMNAERVEGTEYWARIVEVTRTRPAEKVFELHLKEGGQGRWHIYRAQRLPGLYQ